MKNVFKNWKRKEHEDKSLQPYTLVKALWKDKFVYLAFLL